MIIRLFAFHIVKGKTWLHKCYRGTGVQLSRQASCRNKTFRIKIYRNCMFFKTLRCNYSYLLISHYIRTHIPQLDMPNWKHISLYIILWCIFGCVRFTRISLMLQTAIFGMHNYTTCISTIQKLQTNTILQMQLRYNWNSNSKFTGGHCVPHLIALVLSWL